MVLFYAFLLHHKQNPLPEGWQWMRPTADGGFVPYARAAAAGAAHGFIVRGKQLIAPGTTVPGSAAPASQIRLLVKLTLSACVWAAFMTMGMLVYQHFLKRWEERGLPVLPVAALTTVGQTLSRFQSPHGVPIAAGPSSVYERQGERQREPSRQLSLIDEFEG
jgi:hypothetical protein